MNWDKVRSLIEEGFADEINQQGGVAMVMEVVIGARIMYEDGGEQVVTGRSNGSRMIASKLGEYILTDNHDWDRSGSDEL